MMLTITNISQSPQSFPTRSGKTVLLYPGESVEADLSVADRAYVEGAPGHFAVGDTLPDEPEAKPKRTARKRK